MGLRSQRMSVPTRAISTMIARQSVSVVKPARRNVPMTSDQKGSGEAASRLAALLQEADETVHVSVNVYEWKAAFLAARGVSVGRVSADAPSPPDNRGIIGALSDLQRAGAAAAAPRGSPGVPEPAPPTTEPRMCQACWEGDHANCGMQTWCECDCPGSDGDYDYDDESNDGGAGKIVSDTPRSGGPETGSAVDSAKSPTSTTSLSRGSPAGASPPRDVDDVRLDALCGACGHQRRHHQLTAEMASRRGCAVEVDSAWTRTNRRGCGCSRLDGYEPFDGPPVGAGLPRPSEEETK